MNNTPTSSEVAPEEFLALQLMVLHATVRALQANHPKPHAVKASFQQLVAQMQASSALLSSPKSATLLRSFAEDLFQPPAPL
jgi:hypothetical protein